MRDGFWVLLAALWCVDEDNLAAAADFFSHLDGNAAAMRIQRRKSVRMIDDQVLSVARLSGLTDRSVGKRLDRRASSAAMSTP